MNRQLRAKKEAELRVGILSPPVEDICRTVHVKKKKKKNFQ